jgi:PhnB protein
MATISPHIVVGDVEEALAWYGRVFGATEVSRISLPDGGVFTVEIRIGDTSIHLAGEYPDMGIVSPATLGGTYLALQVGTDDVDGTFQRALDAGATVFHPLGDMFYGDRAGQFIDPFGHRWGVYRHVRDVPADEVAREVARMYGGN